MPRRPGCRMDGAAPTRSWPPSPGNTTWPASNSRTLNWKPYPANLNAWERDLTLLPLEVAARTGSQSAAVAAAERRRQSGDLAGALKSYAELADAHNLDVRTLQFMRERRLSLGLEQRLQAGQWVPFLPADTNLTGWHVTYGKCSLEPDGSLEAAPEHYGHLLYSHARVGPNFEARGGVVVAAAAAKILELPLDTLIVRKIGHPVQREFAVGALAEGDVVLFDAAASGLNPLLRGQLDRIVARREAAAGRLPGPVSSSRASNPGRPEGPFGG